MGGANIIFCFREKNSGFFFSGFPFIMIFSFLATATGAEFTKFYHFKAYASELNPQLALVGPSRIQKEKILELHLVSLGKDGNPCEMTSSPLVICNGPRFPHTSGNSPEFEIGFKPVKKGIYKPAKPLKLQYEGYYLLTAKDPENRLLSFGLPVHVTKDPPKLQLHWGDLHGHSTLSDGTGAPEQYYTWARDVAKLDMLAMSDHNWALNEQKIEKIKQMANDWYEPGRFVPFFAFEWAQGKARPHPSRGRPDHKHLIFRRTDENFSPFGIWQDTPSVKKLWELLEGKDVVAIPHHTGLPHDTHYGTDWSLHNEKYERVAEIFSDWGSSEMPGDRYQLPETEEGNFIRDALLRGLHVGFAGGSDTHTSRPGLNTIPHQGHPYPFTALTAIEAPERTRDALWKALYNRRCYATSTGRRILVQFTLNGHPMGSVINIERAKPRIIKSTIAGSSDISEIVIFKNGKGVARFKGKDWCQQISWKDEAPPGEKEDWYYVRAEMADTSMAWASPIWVSQGK